MAKPKQQNPEESPQNLTTTAAPAGDGSAQQGGGQALVKIIKRGTQIGDRLHGAGKQVPCPAELAEKLAKAGAVKIIN